MADIVKDVGYAWVVCAASFMVLVVVGGLTYSMGVLFILFKNGLDAQDSALSLVTSLNVGIVYLVGPVVGLLAERYGERCVGMTGGLIATISIASSSLSKSVYHLYILYGVLGGIGMGMVFTPSISVIAKYFDIYKKTAAGLAVCGTGVGCFVLPPIIKAFEDIYGWRGTLMMVAGINAQTIVFSCFYRSSKKDTKNGVNFDSKNDIELDETSNKRQIRYNNHSLTLVETKPQQCQQYIPDMNATKSVIVSDKEIGKTTSLGKNLSTVKSVQDSENGSNSKNETNDIETDSLSKKNSTNLISRTLCLFGRVHFVCLALYTLVLQFPFAIVYTHFGNYALLLGYSHGDAVYLYMAMGITTLISRILVGILTEVTKANSTVVLTLSAVVNGICTMCLPFTHSLVVMYLYAVTFSSLLSPYHVLHLPMVTEAVPPDQVASGYGTIMCFRVPGTALGAPLAVWLYGYTSVYASSFYLAGALLFANALAMVPALYKILRSRSRKQNKNTSKV